MALRPDSEKAHFNLARALAATGEREKAIEHYAQALRINPDYAKAHINLANALAGLGRTAEAIGHYREGLRLNPQEPLAWRNLAWLLATGADARFRDGPEAVRLAQQACQMTGRKNPVVLDTLAAAYAEAGDFRQAVATAHEAAALASSLGLDKKGVTEIEDRQRLYERGQPCRAGGN